jgi:hypothetical protein
MNVKIYLFTSLLVASIIIVSLIGCQQDDQIQDMSEEPIINDSLGTVRLWISSINNSPVFSIGGKVVSEIKVKILQACLLPEDETYSSYCTDPANYYDLSTYGELEADGSVYFNLLHFTNGGRRFLSEINAVTDNYKLLELKIAETGNTVTIDDTEYDLKTLSSNNSIMVAGDFEVSRNYNTHIEFEIVASESIRYLPGEGYVLDSVIRVIDTENFNIHQAQGPIYTVTINDHTFAYEIVGDYYIAEGDICIGTVSEGFDNYIGVSKENVGTKAMKVIGGTGNERNNRWPGNEIPYDFGFFDATNWPGERAAISRALDTIEDAVPSLNFIERNDEEDYIEFIREDNNICFSRGIGRQGGRQIINLGTGCEREGIIIHEVLHALGFLHEHSRHDRDDFVTINEDNIDEDQVNVRRNFDIRDDGQDVGPYDYDSIMHYDECDFSLANPCGVADQTIDILQTLPNICCGANVSPPCFENIQQCLDAGCANDWANPDRPGCVVDVGHADHLSTVDIQALSAMFAFSNAVDTEYSDEHCSMNDDNCDGPIGYADIVGGDQLADFWAWDSNYNIQIREANGDGSFTDLGTVFTWGDSEADKCELGENRCHGPVGFEQLSNDNFMDFWSFSIWGRISTRLSNGDGTFQGFNAFDWDGGDSDDEIKKCSGDADTGTSDCWGPIGFADFNNDDVMDFWGWDGNGNIDTRLNDGSGSFGSEHSFFLGTDKCSKEEDVDCLGPVGFSDINGDNCDDFWVWRNDGEIHVRLSNCSGDFGSATNIRSWGGADKCDLSEDFCNGPIGFAYISNDNMADLWGFSERGRIIVWLSTSTATTASVGPENDFDWDGDNNRIVKCSLNESTNCYGPVGFSDINGDGMEDFWGWDNDGDIDVRISLGDGTFNEIERFFWYSQDKCRGNENICDGPIGFIDVGGPAGVADGSADFWGWLEDGDIRVRLSLM